MNSGSKVLLGVMAGVAAGAILGVLFAPDKGEETRKKLTEGSKDVADNLKEKFSDFVDSVADKYESVKVGATDLLEQGKSKASSVAQALKKEVNSYATEAILSGKPVTATPAIVKAYVNPLLTNETSQQATLKQKGNSFVDKGKKLRVSSFD